MKHLKMLGLFVMATASMMAFASSASANNPVITSPAGTEYTGQIDLSENSQDGSDVLVSISPSTCTELTILIDITKNTNGVASGPVTSMTKGGCDSTIHVQTPIEGSLEIKSTGEVRLIGTRETVERSGVSCVYGGGTGTKLGTLEGTTLNVSASLPKQGGSFLCPSTASWTAKLTITKPTPFLLN